MQFLYLTALLPVIITVICSNIVRHFRSEMFPTFSEQNIILQCNLLYLPEEDSREVQKQEFKIDYKRYRNKVGMI